MWPWSRAASTAPAGATPDAAAAADAHLVVVEVVVAIAMVDSVLIAAVSRRRLWPI